MSLPILLPWEEGGYNGGDRLAIENGVGYKGIEVPFLPLS